MTLRNDTVKNVIFVTSLILAVVWMCVIFGFSANNAEESTVQSNAVTEMIIRIFNPDFDNLTDAEKEEMIEMYDGRVRKLAHFCAYALLGFLLSISSCNVPFSIKVPYLWPFVVCFVFAMTDEYHQTFVDGRAGRFSDVIIDSSGAICGIAFLFIIMSVIKKKINAKRGA